MPFPPNKKRLILSPTNHTLKIKKRKIDTLANFLPGDFTLSKDRPTITERTFHFRNSQPVSLLHKPYQMINF